MDANGTKYHLLLGKADWGACRLGTLAGARLADAWGPGGDPGAAVAWDEARSELRLTSRAWLFAQPGSAAPPEVRDRRGAARDRYGNWYWIGDTTTEIIARPAGSNVAGRFWTAGTDRCAPPAEPGAFRPRDPAPAPKALALRGLTITEDHYLVVGTLDPGGLLVFDLHGGGAPVHHIWPVRWAPFDLSPRAGGGVWVLERADLDVAGPASIWEIDRQVRVVPPPGAAPARPRAGGFDPGPAIGDHRERNRPISRADARRHRGRHPVAIEGLRDGSVIVVDSEPEARFSTVWRYAGETVASAPLVTDGDIARVVREEDRATFSLRAFDAAVVPARLKRAAWPDAPDDEERPAVDRLYVVAASGNQAFEIELGPAGGPLALTLTGRYLPMRLFGGKALVATSDSLPSYDIGDRWLPLVEQRRPLFAETGTVVSPVGADARFLPAFDSGMPDCTWHRLMLDACIPPGTSITVESQAVNDLRDASDDPRRWFPEPAPYLRRTGSEIPFQPKRTAPGDGTWELLFQRATGRYLLLRLTLRGTGTSTPRIRALRAWYPRFSWLEHYLPDVYRDDEDSASFLDRFLANLEGISTGIEDRIANVQTLFDVRGTPPETLAWLAGWFGLVLDPAWDERRRRLLIDHAMEFFQWRGTPHGLRMALSLALDPCAGPEIFAPPGAAGQPRRSPPFRITETFLRRRGLAGERGIDDVEIAAAGPLGPADRARWQAFLKRRYRRIEAVNEAHRRYGASAWSSFASIGLPDAEPVTVAPRSGPLGGTAPDIAVPAGPLAETALPDLLWVAPALRRDWNDFRLLVLEAGRLAHRFSVVLPARDEPMAEQQARAALARRVIEVAKPAHTVFDVSFSWSAFRVGQARLGDDTFLESRARRAFAMQPLTLNRSGLAQSYLASARDQARADGRRIVGEGNLGA